MYIFNIVSFVALQDRPAVPLQPTNSLLNRPKPAMRGLSCMLFPFLPLNPHLLVSPSSSPSARPKGLLLCPFRFPRSSRGVDGLEFCKLGFRGLELPPRIVETEACAHLGCFRIAEVIVMHSVVIKATGSTATETDIFLELIVLPFDCSIGRVPSVSSRVEFGARSWVEDIGESAICPAELTPSASAFIFGCDTVAAWIRGFEICMEIRWV